jgi:hypothetical protein
VLGQGADMNPSGEGEQGVFARGTRFLSQLALEVGGKKAVLLRSGTSSDNTTLLTKLLSPELEAGEVRLERGSCS